MLTRVILPTGTEFRMGLDCAGRPLGKSGLSASLSSGTIPGETNGPAGGRRAPRRLRRPRISPRSAGRRLRRNKVPIQVIGAGLGRTGTFSLKSALEDLGFAKCYHTVEHWNSDARTWDAALRGEPVDWDTLFAGCRAAVDLPSCLFYRELLEKYPEAKVILTVRDPERWYDSVNQTVYFAHNTFFYWAAVVNPQVRDFRRLINRVLKRLFQGRFEDRAFAIDAFHRHNEQVRRDVPADRLLVYEISQGWGPLCAFLDVPVPEGKPFPHLNDAAEYRAGSSGAPACCGGPSAKEPLPPPCSCLSSSCWL